MRALRKGMRAGVAQRTAGVALVLAALLAGGPPAPAPHTRALRYILQRVGEQVVGGLAIELTAFPPRLEAAAEKALSPEEKHKRLAGFTHRFEIKVREAKSPFRPLEGLRVRLRLSQEGWEKTFDLPPVSSGGEPAYAANVALGPRGPYEVTAEVERGSGERAAAAFSFEYDYETVKEVMAALQEALAALGRETLTLGLDGEFVPPQTEARIQKRAARFKGLIPWIVNLRAGAAQELYVARAERLLGAAGEIESAAGRADWTAVAVGLASARAACESCHRIFQEADSTGKLPRLPPKGGGK